MRDPGLWTTDNTPQDSGHSLLFLLLMMKLKIVEGERLRRCCSVEGLNCEAHCNSNAHVHELSQRGIQILASERVNNKRNASDSTR